MSGYLEPSPDLKQIQAVLLDNGQLYKDPDFPLPRFVPRIRLPVEWKRPKELVRDPQFIVGGASRYDIHQGALQDCYLLAGAACLAVTSQELLTRVVPPNQNFSDNYTGLFYFNFWRDDTWVEVWVDDRLPISDGEPVFGFNRTAGVLNEFWVALLEKAYAKLKGGYENLSGGYINEALVDMTGGISEKIMLSERRRRLEPVLFDLLVKTSKMSSLIGCSIESDEIEEEDLGNGLFGGHAYSVTSLATVNYRGDMVRLVRVRNPWGFAEWRGPWSDGSKEWNYIQSDIKAMLGYHRAHDGEFWMSYKDWLREFDEVAICHLTPDAFLMELTPFMHTSKCWNTVNFSGEWVKGVSAGGCGNKDFPPALFWTNPQFVIEIPQSGDPEQEFTVVISLNQKTLNSNVNKYISFKIFKLKHPHTSKKHYKKSDLKLRESPKDYMNVREVSGHFMLEAGTYVIIPSTFDPGMEGRFSLRVFAEMGCELRT